MRSGQRAEPRWRAGENIDTREEQKERDNESTSHDTTHATSRPRQDNVQDGPASCLVHTTTAEVDFGANAHTKRSVPNQICEANEVLKRVI